MLRYRLDDLGAYQFEKLVQSLLKAAISLGIESWGNRGDWGRDAYCGLPLNFPDPDKTSLGPFVFQAKFVEGANAAGAKPTRALLNSASKELARIRSRIKIRQWHHPKHFVFITNALVGSAAREKLRALFAEELTTASISIWGGDDLCDILDQNTSVGRAFPQLLSIRDLDELISRALTRESRERSDAAVQLATEHVPVFAPTGSYERAWRVLQKHHFAVLEGPPEVGKSAIAWMVGLTQVGLGWEAIVCRTPDTFFQTLNRERPQVFIADDAFGRTEYDPTRTSKWEADLDLILHRLDPRHWLIWTSRKHILERACEKMDAQGKARSFPDPGAVLVDVSELSVEERALILFRHARAAGLEAAAKQLLRAHAFAIVHDAEFTPERIRRFVHESLPGLVSQFDSAKLKSEEVRVAVREALRNPTRQMRLTFQKLPAAYKWFLISLLEISETDEFGLASWRGNLTRLERLYDSYCCDGEREPFATVLTHLREAFIKVRTVRLGEIADWIHPSYRDLVIDELTADSALRNTFLRRISLEGLKLAVSDSGGREGERKLPLIRSAENWDILRERCLSLVSAGSTDSDILEVLGSAASDETSSDHKRRWQRLLGSICAAVCEKWNKEQRELTAHEIEAFAKANKYAEPPAAMPNLERSWGALEERFLESIKIAQNEDFDSFDYAAFDNLTAFARALSDCSPTFLQEKGFPEKYEAEITAILAQARAEAGAQTYTEDPDELRSLAERASNISASVERLGELSAKHPEAFDLSQQLSVLSSQLEEEANRNEPRDPDDGPAYESDRRTDIFDVDMLFSEL